MEYTKEDIDKILEASEKATPGPWHVMLDGFKRGGCPTVYATDDELRYIAFCDDRINIKPTDNIVNAYLVAGAPILAEEIKRLRAENKALRDELCNWPMEYPPDKPVD